MNVPKWVQEMFVDNCTIDCFYDFKQREYTDKKVSVDTLWEWVVLDAPDADMEYVSEQEKNALINSFYRRATKEDWVEMKEKFGDEYKKPMHVAYEQMSIYYDELFRRNCKKFNIVLC